MDSDPWSLTLFLLVSGGFKFSRVMTIKKIKKEVSQKGVDLCAHLESRQARQPSTSVHEVWVAIVQIVQNRSQGQTWAVRK